MIKGPVLIVGASKGLGAEIWANLQQYDVVGVARGQKPADCKGDFIQADLSSGAGFACFEEKIKAINKQFGTVIYCASLYGESGDFRIEELQSFLDVGPLGFLKIIQFLQSNSYLSGNGVIVNIGSTVTLVAGSFIMGPENPVYGAVKEFQRSIAREMQRQLNSDGIRVTTMTVGGLGGDNRIPTEDVISVIDCISGLNTNSRPVEVVMPSISDYVTEG